MVHILFPASQSRRLQRRKHPHTNSRHGQTPRSIRNISPSEPKQRAKQHRPRSPPNLPPTPQPPQDNPTLALPSLQTAQAIQTGDHRRAGDSQQAAGAVQPRQRGNLGEEEERDRAGEHAGAQRGERVQAAHDGALEQGGDEAHRGEETAVEGRGAGGGVGAGVEGGG